MPPGTITLISPILWYFFLNTNRGKIIGIRKNNLMIPSIKYKSMGLYFNKESLFLYLQISMRLGPGPCPGIHIFHRWSTQVKKSRQNNYRVTWPTKLKVGAISRDRYIQGPAQRFREWIKYIYNIQYPFSKIFQNFRELHLMDQFSKSFCRSLILISNARLTLVISFLKLSM